jgi:type I restriction enzyme M protein
MIILFLGGVIVEKLYTIKEFAEIMGIAVVTARLWIKQNKMSQLKDLIEHFSSKTLSIKNCPEDELGIGYEYLIKKFADCFRKKVYLCFSANSYF